MSATVRSEPLGTVERRGLEEGGDVIRWTLTAGGLTAVVWEFGAHLAALTASTNHGDVPLVVPLGDLCDHADPANRGEYLGAVVGPYANRIANGRCTIDGTIVELDTNEGMHHLHGGFVGLDQRRWTTADVGCSDEEASVTLAVELGDGEGGYPGRRRVEATYILGVDHLAIEFVATSDRPTPINVTHHAAWCLADDPDGRLLLAVDAERSLVTDADKIPTGATRRVNVGTLGQAGVDLDDIGRNGEIDCTLVLRPGRTPGAVRRVATLRHEPSGVEVSLRTDQPYLQLFRPHVAVPALCLEPQRAPNGPNAPHLGDWSLRPGEVYRHRSTFDVRIPD